MAEASGLRLGIAKCAIARNSNEPLPPRPDGIPYLDLDNPDDFYTYLGIAQGIHSRPDMVKKNILEKTVKRVSKIVRSKLRSDQMLLALRAHVLPISTYVFRSGVLSCGGPKHHYRLESDEAFALKMDVEIRKRMCAEGLRQSNLSRDRMYMAVRDGGLNFPSALTELYVGIASAVCNLALGPGDMNIAFRIYKHTKCRTVLKDILKIGKTLDIKFNIVRGCVSIDGREYFQHSKAVKGCRERIVQACRDSHKRRFYELARASNRMRNYPLLVPSMGSILQCRMAPRMLRSIMAIHEDAPLLRGHPKQGYIGELRNCRLGCKAVETVKHVLGGCVTAEWKFAASLARHNAMLIPLARLLQKKLDLPITKWGEIPLPLQSSKHGEMVWDQPVSTLNSNCVHNRPDIILTLHKSKRILIIEGAVADLTLIEMRSLAKVETYTNGLCDDSDCRCHKIDSRDIPTIGLRYNMWKVNPNAYSVEVCSIVVGSAGEWNDSTNRRLTDAMIDLNIATSSEMKSVYGHAAQQAACHSAKMLSRHLGRPEHMEKASERVEPNEFEGINFPDNQ